MQGLLVLNRIGPMALMYNYYVHCKKYVVVLTTKWLPELQMSEYEVGVGTQSGNLLLTMNFDMRYKL